MTRPMTGGRLYETAHSVSVHWEKEIGFGPNKLGTDDLAEIIWIQNDAEQGRSDARLVAGHPNFIVGLQLHGSVKFEPSPHGYDRDGYQQLPPESKFSDDDHRENYEISRKPIEMTHHVSNRMG